MPPHLPRRRLGDAEAQAREAETRLAEALRQAEQAKARQLEAQKRVDESARYGSCSTVVRSAVEEKRDDAMTESAIALRHSLFVTGEFLASCC
jgi:hypothetical protein